MLMIKYKKAQVKRTWYKLIINNSLITGKKITFTKIVDALAVLV